jgi:hypothetical protein
MSLPKAKPGMLGPAVRASVAALSPAHGAVRVAAVGAGLRREMDPYVSGGAAGGVRRRVAWDGGIARCVSDGAGAGRQAPPVASARGQHSHAHGDSGGAERGRHAWSIACGAGVLVGFAAWQSRQRALAEAETPSASNEGSRASGASDAPQMTEEAIHNVLKSSDAATLKSALGALLLLVAADDVDNTQGLLARVASKHILSHTDGSVRSAAVCALAALVASDEKEAKASLAALVNAGSVAACHEVLADKSAAAEAVTGAASLLSALSAYEGSWMSSGASRSKGFMDAVAQLARLSVDSSLAAEARVAMVGALGQVMARKGASGVGTNAAVAEEAVGAMALLLMPSRGEDSALRSAALQVLATASHQASLLPLVVSSPTSERIVGMAASELLADSLAALDAMHEMMRASPQVAERLCIDNGATELLVEAAGMHRASKAMREAVASCMEALIASNSEDCKMRVAHFATPVVIALARVSDEEMQVRALRMVRTLSRNGFNKFNMQKSFGVIQELVPFLARSGSSLPLIIRVLFILPMDRRAAAVARH